jgi:hypothetical protein
MCFDLRKADNELNVNESLAASIKSLRFCLFPEYFD